MARDDGEWLRKRHDRVRRELQVDVYLRPGSAARLPAIGHHPGWAPSALGEAPVHQHLDLGVARELSLEMACELWIAAGDNEQTSGHRRFCFMGVSLKRAACDLTTLEEETPQPLLQWDLVPVAGKQRRGLDDDEHRDHDSPKCGP